jgi:hypothetical protein
MAYASVPTVATGDLWTAANHNSYIRDNFAAGVPDIFTTKGDLAVASGPDAAGRLGISANGLILQADSAQGLGMRWAFNQVAVSLSKSGWTLVNNTDTLIPWGSEDLDTHNLVDLVADATKVTIPAGLGGWYLVTSNISFSDQNGTKTLTIWKNGVALNAGQVNVNPQYAKGLSIAKMVYLADTDYLQIKAMQARGTDLTGVIASLDLSLQYKA